MNMIGKINGREIYWDVVVLVLILLKAVASVDVMMPLCIKMTQTNQAG